MSLLRTGGPMSVNEPAVAMDCKSANPSIRQMIKTMMLCGKVHCLYPESPRAGKQKIALDERSVHACSDLTLLYPSLFRQAHRTMYTADAASMIAPSPVT